MTGFLSAPLSCPSSSEELQAPGKKKMRAADYLNGHGISLPAVFA